MDWCVDWSVRPDVLDYLLKRGYGTKSLYESGEYVMDSLRFLKDNDAVVGVLQSGVFVKKEDWDDFVFLVESDPKIVYKMWVPFQDLLQNNVPFQIIRDDLQWNKHKIRWEYEPTSCWKPSKVSYKGRKQQLKHTIQAWVESPSMLISDKEEFIICHATEHGWESKPVMKHEGLLPYQKAIEINNILLDLIHQKRHSTKIQEYYRYTAHFHYSMALRLGIKIPIELFSLFDADEERVLQGYEEALALHSGQATEVRRHLRKQSEQNTCPQANASTSRFSS